MTCLGKTITISMILQRKRQYWLTAEVPPIECQVEVDRYRPPVVGRKEVAMPTLSVSSIRCFPTWPSYGHGSQPRAVGAIYLRQTILRVNKRS